jgi:hypothetical protein
MRKFSHKVCSLLFVLTFPQVVYELFNTSVICLVCHHVRVCCVHTVCLRRESFISLMHIYIMYVSFVFYFIFGSFGSHSLSLHFFLLLLYLSVCARTFVCTLYLYLLYI